VEQAAALDADVLCEQFISGDEVTCPVLGTGDSARPAGDPHRGARGQLRLPEQVFHRRHQVPRACGLPEGEEQAIQEIVLKAYRVLGCRGWGRVDVMIDAATRKPYLLEINTSPGMTAIRWCRCRRAPRHQLRGPVPAAAGLGLAGPGEGSAHMTRHVPAPFDVKLMNITATALLSACVVLLLAAAAWWALRHPLFPSAASRCRATSPQQRRDLRANVAPRLAATFSP
jgi:hypothetical protein